MSKLPKIQDLYLDKEQAHKNDALQTLLNSQPKEEWVKLHPYIKGYRYLPIDKIEFLLQKIFLEDRPGLMELLFLKYHFQFLQKYWD